MSCPFPSYPGLSYLSYPYPTYPTYVPYPTVPCPVMSHLFFWWCSVLCCALLLFAAVQVDYNKPAGFDRARNREVGKKDITLETMEEAFTSEHWIVRIFKASVCVCRYIMCLLLRKCNILLFFSLERRNKRIRERHERNGSILV